MARLVLIISGGVLLPMPLTVLDALSGLPMTQTTWGWLVNTVAIAANTGNNALTCSVTLTLKRKTAVEGMSLAGASAFDLSAEEIAAIHTGATGPMTDAGVKAITAQNVRRNANGQISTSSANRIDIAPANLSTNTTRNANGYIRTGVINMGVGTGNISAGTLNVKTLANASAAITLTNSPNTTIVVDLKTRNLADTSNAAGVIQYFDATGFDAAAIATTGMPLCRLLVR